ncbi:MAG: hypothetical protein ACTHXI_05955, partial [Halomonadaceae bacterium]
MGTRLHEKRKIEGEKNHGSREQPRAGYLRPDDDGCTTAYALAGETWPVGAYKVVRLHLGKELWYKAARFPAIVRRVRRRLAGAFLLSARVLSELRRKKEAVKASR